MTRTDYDRQAYLNAVCGKSKHALDAFLNRPRRAQSIRTMQDHSTSQRKRPVSLVSAPWESSDG